MTTETAQSPSISPDQARALTSITLFAAFADGSPSDPERAAIKRLVDSLNNDTTSDALRRVVMKETNLQAETAYLTTPELRTLAWESALNVCEADGATSSAERQFLDALAKSLNYPNAAQDIAQADSISRAATSATTPPLPTTPTDARHPTANTQADATTLQFAILTAAVELLPNSLATMAIIPLQTKMVHSIGSSYGYKLSAESIKELAATVGVGVTGQVVESYAKKFLGSLLGKGMLANAGRAALHWGAGPAMTFATTYAMGMVAKQYYAGGRKLSAIDLKTLFSQQVEQAKDLYARVEPQVRQTAARTNPMQLLQSLSA